MSNNFEQFIQQLIPVFADESLTLEERLAQITAQYIDMLKANPDLPFFIMNQMRSDSSKLLNVREKMTAVREGFLKNLGKNMKGGKATQANITHFMMNYMGLVIFPFIARPMLMKVNGLNKKGFDDLMEERKKIIPVWLGAIMKAE